MSQNISNFFEGTDINEVFDKSNDYMFKKFNSIFSFYFNVEIFENKSYKHNKYILILF